MESLRVLVTYSPQWSDSGEEWSQVENFQNRDFLYSYVETMGWRVMSVKIMEER